MSRADYADPLYRESIPVRISRPPHTLDGPTARWMMAHPENVTALPLPTQLPDDAAVSA